MCEERPMEQLASFIVAAAIGAILMFSFQQYGRYTANSVEKKFQKAQAT